MLLAQKIAGVAPVVERENWYKQVIDGLATSYALGEKDNSPVVLAKWKTHFSTTQAGGALAAYAAYREVWASYQNEMIGKGAGALSKIQDQYHVALRKFVEAYPKSDDTPDALLQLAMGSEFIGKDDEAKKYYTEIATTFPTHVNAPKSAGAVRRLDAVGKELDITSPTLAGGNFSMANARGKVTVVYYWSTLSGQKDGDFATLKKVQEAFAKEVILVTVNLDDTAESATAFVQRTPLQAFHLHHAGGMNGPLATNYGIFGLPHVFLVGADGKVVSNKVQVGMLEEEIGKILKK